MATKTPRVSPQYLRICPRTYPARPPAQNGSLKTVDGRASAKERRKPAAWARTAPVPLREAVSRFDVKTSKCKIADRSDRARKEVDHVRKGAALSRKAARVCLAAS